MHRIMLETLVHDQSSFLTLTYSNDQLPVNSDGLASLVPEDLTKFMKRLRRKLEPLRVRFFACGEYGDETERPHYHAAVFGFGSCARGRTKRVPGKSEPRWADCCSTCVTVGEAWGRGIVEVGELNSFTAAYVAGYVVKKMTSTGDPRLRGRHPEFARMSNRPGIGYGALVEVAATLKRHDLVNLDDVPGALRHGKKIYPLGRYLTGGLREEMGMDRAAPEATLKRLDEALSVVREDAFNRSVSFRDAIVEANEGRRDSMLGRYKIFNQRRVL